MKTRIPWCLRDIFFSFKTVPWCSCSYKQDSLPCPSPEHGWTEQSWVSRPTSCSQFTGITVIICCQLLQIADPDILAKLLPVWCFLFPSLNCFSFSLTVKWVLHNVVSSPYLCVVRARARKPVPTHTGRCTNRI